MTPGPLRVAHPAGLAHALADRYRLEREVGAGGMARVYLAEDVKHGRRVALKVLRPEVTADLGSGRFGREIGIAAQLRHPHILPLFDSGDADGTPFYVMPYVEGETLRDRLRRERQLPVDEAIRLASEIADALAYAHAHGVVHRDVKPENVLLESGHAVVADFGIARAVAMATRDGHDGARERLTGTGVSLGTPAYMSPEQIAADGDVDGRSDVYALGCVLYEMLAGEPPFTGSAASVLRQHLLDAPRPIAELRADTPRDVAALLTRALAKDPAERPDGAAELLAGLAGSGRVARPASVVPRPRVERRWRTVAAALGARAALGAAALGGGWALRRGAAGRRGGAEIAPADQKYVVAVLPFESLSADSAKAYFAAGLTEEVTAALSRLSALRVMSRSAVRPYAPVADRLARLRKELGVGSIIEGSVRVNGDSARVTVRLVDARSEGTVWSTERDVAIADALVVQSQLARTIADALRARVTPAEARRRGRPPTISPEAYELYLRATRMPVAVAASNREAMDLLRRAVALDAGFALAHYELAHRYTFLAYGRGSAYVDSGMAQARAAIAADPELANGYFVLGDLQSYSGRFDDARASYLRSLALDPNYDWAMNDLGFNEELAGRFDEALHWHALAFRLAPNTADAFYHVEAALVHIGDDAFDERFFARAAARFPESRRLALSLARLELLLGRDSIAADRTRRTLSRSPADQESQMFAAEVATVTRAADAESFLAPLVREAPDGRGDFLAESFRTQLGLALAGRGERARAESLWAASAALAQRQIAEGHESPALRVELAAIASVRGDSAAALDWLQRGYDAGWTDARITALDPFLEPLRTHTRYGAVVARMRADLAAMRRRAEAAHPEFFPTREVPNDSGVRDE
ncbi:protein kinase (plasmid) [Gemmatirosa kalamazoonensis]|uniref:non-specific serine/threonine protein kinase n=1 Tax=Gemmatirosa kalamazoonensis TaxID=861299 RepID=W0RRQ0_9BACT|nr:serine/threonine-protein kinase [Gemmatirosa kalamazoonensis]AHG93371.1 protein kinase [Gemmatirosa kalamazoonensis]